MKRVLLLFAFAILTLGVISAAQVHVKDSFSLGENLIAKVSGSFNTTLTKSNVHFYRNGVPTSFSPYSLDYIDSDYYISFSVPVEKTPGNYSIQIKGISYYTGSSYIDTPLEGNFEILNKRAWGKVTPALSIPSDYYYNLTLKSLSPEKIQIDYGLEGTTPKTVNLNPGETKNVTLKTFGGNNFESIIFKSGNESYSSIVYSTLPEIPVENATAPAENETTNNETANETGNESKSIWDIIFGDKSNEENTTVVNETNNDSSFANGTNTSNSQNEGTSLRTCSQLGLTVCSDNQECDGKTVNAKDTQCCDGTCTEKDTGGSSLGIVGWLIIGIAVIILFLFFKFKFSKTRRVPSRLLRR